jgi:peptide/nickel transport system substrate-binding protein
VSLSPRASATTSRSRIAQSVTLATTAALLLAACSTPAPAATTAKRGESLTLGAVFDITSWDPAQAHVGHQLQPYQAAYDTLILRTPDGAYAPMLATEWKYNADETELTLELRADVTFSDGEKFDAEAVKANLEAFKAANGKQAAQLSALEKVEAVDEDTARISLTAPDPAFTYYLSQAAGLMGSPAALGTDDIAAVPVGSGPYVMDAANSIAGSQYVFTAREDYWNPVLQKFNRIEFKVLNDVTARVNALVTGAVDATLVDARSAKQAEASGKMLIANEVDWNGLLLMDRDGEINPALADVRVRQAINHALDRETMLKELQMGYGTVTDQVFGVYSGAYVEDLEGTYPFDPKKARNLLADAGYANGFELTVPTAAGLEPIMAVVGQQLADVGITLKPEAVPFPSLVPDIAAGKYAAAYFFLFQGDAWVAINQMISTEALYNPFDSSSPELQELIDDVHFDADKRAKAAEAVNRYVTEEAWFAPLFRVNQMFYIDAKKIAVAPQVQQAVPSIYNFAPAK